MSKASIVLVICLPTLFDQEIRRTVRPSIIVVLQGGILWVAEIIKSFIVAISVLIAVPEVNNEHLLEWARGTAYEYGIVAHCFPGCYAT